MLHWFALLFSQEERRQKRQENREDAARPRGRRVRDEIERAQREKGSGSGIRHTVRQCRRQEKGRRKEGKAGIEGALSLARND